MKNANSTNIDNLDVWTMLLSTVRYSLGRSTYMSSLVPGLVRKYASALTEEQLAQLVREVDQELVRCERSGTFLGMECDHRSWRLFTLEYSEYLPKEVAMTFAVGKP